MKYEGICVGGPDDGKRLSFHDTVVKRLGHREAEDYSRASPLPERKDTDDVCVYYFTSLAILGRDAFNPGYEVKYGFWLAKPLTLEDAMQALMRRYEEPRRARKLLQAAKTLLVRCGKAIIASDPATNSEYVELMDSIKKELEDGS